MNNSRSYPGCARFHLLCKNFLGDFLRLPKQAENKKKSAEVVINDASPSFTAHESQVSPLKRKSNQDDDWNW